MGEDEGKKFASSKDLEYFECSAVRTLTCWYTVGTIIIIHSTCRRSLIILTNHSYSWLNNSIKYTVIRLMRNRKCLLLLSNYCNFGSNYYNDYAIITFEVVILDSLTENQNQHCIMWLHKLSQRHTWFDYTDIAMWLYFEVWSGSMLQLCVTFQLIPLRCLSP